MKYLGSKNRLSKELAPIIQSYINNSTVGYIEPFVGGGNMIDKISHTNKIGYDIHHYLIAVLNAFAKGWEPPRELSEDLYADIKANPENYEPCLVGYAGFQLSYGGMWFGGYRRDKVGKRNYADEAYRNSMKQIPLLAGCKFEERDFRAIDITKLSGYVIYCDPPYRGTTGYCTKDFPYEEFYQWVKVLSKNNIVLVSEYWMPEDFTCIWSKKQKIYVNNTGKGSKVKVEKLYRYI